MRYQLSETVRVGLKTGRRKTGRANFDILLDITFLIWNRHGLECSRIWKLSGNFIKKCRDFLGRDILGTMFFRANTTVITLILVFTIYMIFYAITLCFIMFICPFVGPLIWTNKILSILSILFLSIIIFTVE
jgi:hypothetical protein